MPPSVQVALESWSCPVGLTFAVVLAGVLYLRGWLRLISPCVNAIPSWRAGSFFLGLFLIWVAVGSPLAAFDEELVMPLLHALPRKFLQSILGPLFRSPAMQGIGRVLSQPAFCWLAAAAALLGWHVPAAFTLGLQSGAWHAIEHACFLGSGFLFWWPVVQPWPSVPRWPRWSMLVYLFLATLPCDILSAFLAFCDRVVYTVYLSTPKHSVISALEDQQCAGALMWTCVTIVYLLAAAILTTRLLSARSTPESELMQLDLHPTLAPRTGS